MTTGDSSSNSHKKTRTAKSASIITGPTFLTIIRMILSVAFMVFILQPRSYAKIVSLALFIVAAITDKIDGIWARKQKLVTDMGAFLDPLADKMLVDLAFLALVQVRIIPIWAFAIILVRDLAVDGMRMMVARKGTTVPASYLGKLKTTFQMFALIALQIGIVAEAGLISVIGYIVLYIALVFTLISGIDYLIKGWRKIS